MVSTQVLNSASSLLYAFASFFSSWPDNRFKISEPVGEGSIQMEVASLPFSFPTFSSTSRPKVIKDFGIPEESLRSILTREIGGTPLLTPYKGLTLFHDQAVATVYFNTGYGYIPNNISSCNVVEVNTPEERALTLATYARLNDTRIQETDFNTMLNIISGCGKLEVKDKAQAPPRSNKASTAGMQSSTLRGTKWCGVGDQAKNYHDLGWREDVDKCCRDHDLCPIKVMSFRRGYGDLINSSFYTKSHCACDQRLKNCLKSVNSPLANNLMRLYFNVLRAQCLTGTNGVYTFDSID